MKYNNIKQITENEIKSLVKEQVQEHTNLEYKREIKFSNDAEKKELLADVCSFANSNGGVILYGIEEEKDSNEKNTGIPKQITGLKLNIDETTRSLDESIRRSIEPVLIGVNINSIEIDNKTVLTIFIPQSSSSPHRVKFKGSNKFWKRANTNRYEIPIEELRQDFLKGTELSKRISEFRSERITKILSNDTPVKLQEGPKLVLHIVPVIHFDRHQAFNLSQWNQTNEFDFQSISSLEYNSWGNRKLNFDGLVYYSSEDKPLSYTQLFRNAAVEAIDIDYQISYTQVDKSLNLQNYEESLIRVLDLYCSSLVKKSINGPCIVFLSILNVKGYRIRQTNRYFTLDKSPIDRNNLLLPDVYIEDMNHFSAPEIMKPVFNMVWNACGYPGSKNYDKNGKWKPNV